MPGCHMAEGGVAHPVMDDSVDSIKVCVSRDLHSCSEFITDCSVARFCRNFKKKLLSFAILGFRVLGFSNSVNIERHSHHECCSNPRLLEGILNVLREAFQTFATIAAMEIGCGFGSRSCHPWVSPHVEAWAGSSQKSNGGLDAGIGAAKLQCFAIRINVTRSQCSSSGCKTSPLIWHWHLHQHAAFSSSISV